MNSCSPASARYLATVFEVRFLVESVEPVQVDPAGYPLSVGHRPGGALRFLDWRGRELALAPVSDLARCLTALSQGDPWEPDGIHLDTTRRSWRLALAARGDAQHHFPVDSSAISASITTALADLDAWTLLNLYTTRVSAEGGGVS